MRKGILAAMACVVACSGWFTAVAARADGPTSQYDLFYNYYQGGSRQGGVPVQMYPSPIPVPPYVGQTGITYQPLMPHEFLYPHRRTYRRSNGVVPVNTTRVFWYRGSNWSFKGLGGRGFGVGY